MLVEVDGIFYQILERNYAKNWIHYFDHLENRDEYTYLNGRYLKEGNIVQDGFEYKYSRYINEGE